MASFHLAQINIGRLVAPVDDPQIAGFVAQLDSVNRLAEESPGFVWRLQDDIGNATSLGYNGDPLMIANMSVWESLETLKEFTYRSRHVEVLRDRAKWFSKMDLPHYCLWWIPEGDIPTLAEGRARMECYQRNGSTPYSFWFNRWFPAEALELALA